MSERLAAHAAGELPPEEAAAVEAALAEDGLLRAELARIRKVDTLLAELPEVAMPEAFRVTLHQALRDEIATNAEVVDLASRRSMPRWALAGSAVAAAAAIVFGVANLGSLGGNDAELTSMDSMAAEAAGGQASSDMATALAPESLEPQYVTGGVYDRDSLVDLGQDGRILGTLGQAALDPGGARDRYTEQLLAAAGGGNEGARTGVASSGEAGPAADAAPAPDQPAADGAAQDDAAQDGGAGGGEAANPVQACLPSILEGDRVPLFADLGTFEDQEALIFVLGAPSADGNFDRLEFWVLNPNSCEVRHFAQLDT